MTMQVKSNIWFEVDGRVVLSRWRIRLLRAVEQTGSISKAADLMEVPYRRAWEKIHESEERLGFKLVETQVGGVGGGGARLTTACTDLIQQYDTIVQGVGEILTRRFDDTFNSSP